MILIFNKNFPSDILFCEKKKATVVLKKATEEHLTLKQDFSIKLRILKD